MQVREMIQIVVANGIMLHWSQIPVCPHISLSFSIRVADAFYYLSYCGLGFGFNSWGSVSVGIGVCTII